MEANPETVDERRLEGFRAAGVNRVSFGVQSFRDSELRRLGRLHDAARARAAVAEARRAGFDNLSLDLMLWLPGQSLAHLDESLAALVEAGPEHASLYLLEIYPNAPLKDEMARAGWSQAPDDDAADMYLRTMGRLKGRDTAVRDFQPRAARARVAAQHQVLDRRRVDWLRLRCALDSGARAVEQCPRHVRLRQSHRAARVAGGRAPRALSTREQIEEALFMELRLADGVRLDRIRTVYGVDVWSEWGSRLAPFAEAGLLVHDPARLRLTRSGHASGQRRNEHFPRSGQYVKVTVFPT